MSLKRISKFNGIPSTTRSATNSATQKKKINRVGFCVVCGRRHRLKINNIPYKHSYGPLTPGLSTSCPGNSLVSNIRMVVCPDGHNCTYSALTGTLTGHCDSVGLDCFWSGIEFNYETYIKNGAASESW